MRGYKTLWIHDLKGRTYKLELSKNQKVVKIHRIKETINFAENAKVQEELSINAFLLYMYLVRHQQDRVWALSSKDVYPKTHLTESTYRKAMHELIEKEYLTKGTIDLGADGIYKEESYHFWEVPSLRHKSIPLGEEVFVMDE